MVSRLELAMTLLLVILNLAVHASFIWAGFRLFRPPGLRKTPRCTRVIELSTVIAIGLGTLAVARREGGGCLRDCIAIGIAVCSLGLFVWAARTVRHTPLTYAFADDRPTFLITGGPFRLNRNPFYTSYLLAYVFALVASGNLSLLAVLGWLAAVYAVAARTEERKFLSSPLRAAYLRYQQRTGRFLPRPWCILSTGNRTDAAAPCAAISR